MALVRIPVLVFQVEKIRRFSVVEMDCVRGAKHEKCKMSRAAPLRMITSCAHSPLTYYHLQITGLSVGTI